MNGNKRIKELTLLERPREKAFAYGVKQLANAELLAILIGSGIPGFSALSLAQNLLHRYGSLIHLMRLPFHEWVGIQGIHRVKAIQMLALFELFQRLEKEELPTTKLDDPRVVYQHYRLRLGSLAHEQLLIVKLNHQLHYTGETIFRLGAQATIQMDIREVFVDLLKSDTKKFILLHNHPSGDVTPSQADISTTLQLKQEGQRLGFLLIDHLIISLRGYFSMKQEKLL